MCQWDFDSWSFWLKHSSVNFSFLVLPCCPKWTCLLRSGSCSSKAKCLHRGDWKSVVNCPSSGWRTMRERQMKLTDSKKQKDREWRRVTRVASENQKQNTSNCFIVLAVRSAFVFLVVCAARVVFFLSVSSSAPFALVFSGLSPCLSFVLFCFVFFVALVVVLLCWSFILWRCLVYRASPFRSLVCVFFVVHFVYLCWSCAGVSPVSSFIGPCLTDL